MWFVPTKGITPFRRPGPGPLSGPFFVNVLVWWFLFTFCVYKQLILFRITKMISAARLVKAFLPCVWGSSRLIDRFKCPSPWQFHQRYKWNLTIRVLRLYLPNHPH